MSADAATLVSGVVTELLAAGRFRLQMADGSHVTAVAAAGVSLTEVATGDRVSMMPGEAELAGMIVGVEPPVVAPARSTSPFTRQASRLSPDKLKIDRAARPEWPTAAERLPIVGEQVYCTEGMCSVTRVLGRTGNGSRLLELRLEGGDRRPFFAAASNVLVHPGVA